MSEKILIVDDNKSICEVLEFNLASEGYMVDCAFSAEEALDKLTPDHALVLLDVMMGGMSGYKMAETLRRTKNNIPIIFLTAKDTENDMLTAFSVGADDYIAKPFSIKEVVVRVKALLKRAEIGHRHSVETEIGRDAQLHISTAHGKITLNFDTKELLVDGKRVKLTRTEFELLALLAANPQKVFDRDAIINRVWKDTPYITERTVDVHIGRLRKKLGDHSTLIVSRPGYGYCLEDK